MAIVADRHTELSLLIMIIKDKCSVKSVSCSFLSSASDH